MNVPDEHLAELVELYDETLKCELENHTDLDEVDVAALRAVLDRHEQMVRQQIVAEMRRLAVLHCGDTSIEGNDSATARWLADQIEAGTTSGTVALADPHAGVVDLSEAEAASFMAALTEGRDDRAEIEREVRAKIAEELREDAAAHRRLVARKPSKYDEARLARARTLDDAAARISRMPRGDSDVR